VSFDADKMKDRKVERADDWHRPPPSKIKPGVKLTVPDPDLEGHEIEVADVYQDDEGKWVVKDTAGAEWNWGKGFKVVPPKPKEPSTSTTPTQTLTDMLEQKPKKEAPKSPKSEEVLDIDEGGFKQVGPQTGSNPGGMYQADNGDKYYVKTPKSEDRARNEILAGRLYELAGIDIPELSPATRDGKFSVASRIIPGLSEDSNALRGGKVKGVLEGIAVDAWLSNWDVVGLDYDNLLVDGEGNGRRVDTGGALRYRAMGAPKGDAFGDEVTELDIFTDPDRKSGSVFHHATPQQIVDSIDRVLDIPEDKIRDLVDQWGPKGAERDKLFKTLLARRESLKKQREKYAKKAAEKKAAARVIRVALQRPEFRKVLLREAFR
jgi:hypothetical protein